MKDIVPDEVIVGLLLAEPSHGYRLLERFNSPEHLGRIWTMSTSQLYAVLKRLENNGSITGKEVDAASAPPRIVYTATEKGERKLQSWLNEVEPSTSIHRIRVLFLSRLYISNMLELPTAPIIDYQRKVCIKQRNRLTNEYRKTRSPVEKLALDFVIGQLSAAIAWLEKVEVDIPEMEDFEFSL